MKIMIADDIMEILQANNFGTISTSILLNRLPEIAPAPDNCIGLFPLASPPQMINIPEQRYVFSLMLRDREYDTGYEKAIAIHKMLSRQVVTAPSGRKMFFRPAAPPYFLEYDPNRRSRFVYNFDLFTVPD